MFDGGACATQTEPTEGPLSLLSPQRGPPAPVIVSVTRARSPFREVNLMRRYVPGLETGGLLMKCSEIQEKHHTQKCSFQKYLK